MKDRIRDIFDKEGEIDKKILELEKIVTQEGDPKVKLDSARAIIEELKRDLVDTHYESLTDDLTGFLNKKAIVDIYTKKLSVCLKEGLGLSLILLDIDDLKHYNDTFGHYEGTELIKNFSIAIENSIRKSDIASRYGGDEFLLICVNSKGTSANKIIERLQVNIAKIKTVSGKPITASIGFATYDKKRTSFEEMFIEADKMLYENKAKKNLTNPFK